MVVSMIISASRRTDIPRFYSPWFFGRLEEGFVQVRNPMNPRQVSQVSLTKEAIDCICFWTKDPLPMLPKIPWLIEHEYPFYFQFTLTPYQKELEVNVREKSEIIKTFISLSKLIGAEKIVWRYDPIVLNDKYTIEYHLKAFEEFCSKLGGYTQTVYISFVDIYRKIKKQTAASLLREITGEEMILLAGGLSEIGARYGMRVRSCCEEVLLSVPGVQKGSCIDPELVEKLLNRPIKRLKAASQRAGCNCIDSVDIGAYDTCSNGCLYCYANTSIEGAVKNHRLHDTKGSMLIGAVTEYDKVTERAIKKL